MKSEALRKVLAVQAVEQSDPEGEILRDSDLREAAAIAGAPLPKSASDDECESFLAERAEVLSVRVLSRFPGAGSWLQPTPGGNRIGLLTVGLMLLAAVLGFLSNELGPENRINILSFPLLGILAWSLLISLREVFLLFRSRDSIPQSSIGVLRTLLEGRKRDSSPRQTPTTEAEARLDAAKTLFESRWMDLTTPNTHAKIKIMLHSVAVALAVSAVAGMYLKGLANEYRAVWESTFFTDGESLLPFLQFVLGPAAALLGDSLPSAEVLEEMHWQATDGEVAGENAARWIHWYAVTLFLFVVLPRLTFILLWKGKDFRYSFTLPYRNVAPRYFEHLLAISSGSAREFALVPYGLDLDAASMRTIERHLQSFLEGPVDLVFTDPVSFGDEEDLEELQIEDRTRPLVPLLNFASTPERETHLQLIDSIEKKTGNEIPFLVLDASDFDRKAEGLREAGQKRKDREEAWRLLLAEKPRELVIATSGDTTRI